MEVYYYRPLILVDFGLSVTLILGDFTYICKFFSWFRSLPWRWRNLKIQTSWQRRFNLAKTIVSSSPFASFMDFGTKRWKSHLGRQPRSQYKWRCITIDPWFWSILEFRLRWFCVILHTFVWFLADFNSDLLRMVGSESICYRIAQFKFLNLDVTISESKHFLQHMHNIFYTIHIYIYIYICNPVCSLTFGRLMRRLAWLSDCLIYVYMYMYMIYSIYIYIYIYDRQHIIHNNPCCISTR